MRNTSFFSYLLLPHLRQFLEHPVRRPRVVNRTVRPPLVYAEMRRKLFQGELHELRITAQEEPRHRKRIKSFIEKVRLRAKLLQQYQKVRPVKRQVMSHKQGVLRDGKEFLDAFFRAHSLARPFLRIIAVYFKRLRPGGPPKFSPFFFFFSFSLPPTPPPP